MIIWITLDEILTFHIKIAKNTGGSHGVRDVGLIESSINKAFSSFGGKDFYMNLENKISTTTFSLINNHCFLDGNKRIGIATMLYLLQLNNISINYTQKELINLGLGIAKGDLSEEQLLKWIIKHKLC